MNWEDIPWKANLDGREHTVPLRKPLQIFFLREGISSIRRILLNFCHDMLAFLLFKTKICLQLGATLLFDHVSPWHASFLLLYRLSFSRSLLGYKSMTARSNPQVTLHPDPSAFGSCDQMGNVNLVVAGHFHVMFAFI